MRCQFFRCVECEEDRPEFEFESRTSANCERERCVICLSCRQAAKVESDRIRYEEDLAARRERAVKAKENKDDPASRRAASLQLARVRWRDVTKIRDIYREARRLSDETGERHHVDHYYPLQGQYCCGLHVHQNLRVMRAVLNCSKSNAMPLDESPALKSWLEENSQSVLTAIKLDLTNQGAKP